MGGVESDSMKSARKTKDKLHKACERASETHERTLHGQEQNRMRMASMSQHTSTITCTAASRVWHFSAFHYLGNTPTEERYEQHSCVAMVMGSTNPHTPAIF